MLLLDGPEHLRQRRLMLPPFHGERMRAYGDVMRAVAERHVEQLAASGARFPAQPSMQAITLEVILRAVFGVEDERRRRAARGAAARAARRDRQPLRLLLLQLTSSRARAAQPLGPLPRADGAGRRAGLRGDRARAAPSAGASATTSSRCCWPRATRRASALTDAELRDELMTLLLAGHETTATALAGRSSGSCATPRCSRGCVDEQREGGDEYLDAVIKETLRLRPGRARRSSASCTAPIEVGGMRAARGRARRAVDLPAAPPRRPLPRSDARSGRSASSSDAPPAPTSGSRSAAASAAAWAPASRCTR